MYFTKPMLQKIFRLGTFFAILLVQLDLLTFFYYPDTTFGSIFLATREQTPLTWVSVVVLLLIGFSSITKYTKTKKKIWKVLAAIFLFFSMDDATYFHERFSAGIQETVPFLASFPSYSWIVLYLPLILFGIGALIYLLWKEVTGKQRKALVLAIFLLGLSLVLDMADGWVEKSQTLVFCLDPKCSRTMAHLFRLTEEVSEVFGLGILAHLNAKKNLLKK